jgi:late competence protein required for DNA uptake (superfamily II DNA/RNA helicase)
MTKQNDDKLNELDKIYGENDKFRAEAAHNALKFSTDKVDEMRQSLKRFVDWAIDMARDLLPELIKKAEDQFICSYCLQVCDSITLVSPCNHMFCADCLAGDKSYKCNCGEVKEATARLENVGKWLTDLKVYKKRV